MKARLRLTGILIQAQAMVDDGDSLVPITHDAARLSVEEFKEYVSSGRFDDEVKKWEANVLAERGEGNRAQRRSKTPAKAKPAKPSTRKK